MNNRHSIAISELTSGPWLIDAHAGHLAFQTLMEHGAPVDSVVRPAERKMGFIPLVGLDLPDLTNQVYLALGEVPTQAGVLVIEYDGLLYNYSSRWIEAELRWADRTPEILGVVLKVSGPGGLEHAAYRVSDAVAELKKPVVMYCDHGLLGSSWYLVACHCDQIVASRPTDEIGSIGVYCTFQDWSAGYKKSGVVVEDIYAEQSTEKNLEYRRAKDGDFQPMKALMTQKAERFIEDVKSRRPGVKATKAGDPFKGGLFTADVALELGLVDQVGTLSEAYATVLTLMVESSHAQTNPDTMFGYMKLAALLAVKGLTAEQITQEQIDAINAELTANGIQGLALVSQAQFASAVESANGSTGLQSQLMAQTTQLATITAERDTLKTQVASLEAKVTELGGAPGADPTNPNKTVTETPVGEMTADKLIASLPHNQEFANLPYLK
ncbi:S49 family peptidase [Larkinella soli]|uniref:S49 family peptidase n=1 Tax=Larkinella soli TaxID=1770527 RepID=UPI000FFB1423|nr:S49 family peptidase [Larkinella soli]